MNTHYRFAVVSSLILLTLGCSKFFDRLRPSSEDSDSMESADSGTQSDLNPSYGYYPSADRPGKVGNTISTEDTPDLPPVTKRLYKHGNRATRDDFIDQSEEEGSLWASNGQTNYYFVKNKIKSPGDIVSLKIEDDLFKDIGAEVKKILSPKEKKAEIAEAQAKLRMKFLASLMSSQKDTLSTSAAGPDRTLASGNGGTGNSSGAEAQPGSSPTPTITPNNAPAVSSLSEEEIGKMIPKATLADTDIFQSMELKSGETMMGEILERYPNGNYKIRTLKRIRYKYGPPRLVSVTGIVSASDINEDTNVVDSGKLYEYQIAVAR